MGVSEKKVVTNLVWRFLERSGAQLVSFIVSMVIARILLPEEYGVVALITVFTTILQVFVDSGLGNALIQKKDADELDFSTVFFTNVFFCLILYIVICMAAPLLAKFYNNEALIPYIRVLSLTIVISGVKNIQQAYISKKMMFKKFFWSTLSGTIIAAIVGIVMALWGFGVWALIAQQLINLFIGTIVLWFTVNWRPKWQFSFDRLKALYSYGWKLLVSALLDTVYNNCRQLIIGRMYTPSDLAFYNKGKQFPEIVVTNVNTSIDSVLLPAMSEVQDETEKVRSMTRKSIKVSTFIMAPLMMGLAFTAPAVVQLVLTSKWLDCVLYLQIFCITYMFYPIHTANLNAIKAIGRSDLFLKLEVAKKVVGLILLFATMWFGVKAMAYSLIVSSFFSQIINATPNKKILNYGYIEQLKDILPSISLAIFMGICVGLVSLINMPTIILLVVQVFVGVCIYAIGSHVLKLEAYTYALSVLKKFRK